MVHKEDLQNIYQHCKTEFAELDQKTIFVTGGTGFFGKWLLEAIIYANETASLEIKCIILSRDPSVFLSAYPQFRRSYLLFVKGDITSFAFPEDKIDFIFHMATEANVSLNNETPLLMFDVIVEGTRRVLELAKVKKVKAVLLTSSGAIYGQQPAEMERIPETYKGAPDIYNKTVAYGEGKRVAELLSNFYYNHYGVNTKIARCFAFVGPYLPLDTHFAIGNFINDILEEKDVLINGDGTPYRSYMYASDLVIWLIKILFHAQTCDPINVGSDQFLTIQELAQTILNLCPDSTAKISIAKKSSSKIVQRYVPSIEKAKDMLGLSVTVPLEESILRTIAFNKNYLKLN